MEATYNEFIKFLGIKGLSRKLGDKRIRKMIENHEIYLEENWTKNTPKEEWSKDIKISYKGEELRVVNFYSWKRAEYGKFSALSARIREIWERYNCEEKWKSNLFPREWEEVFKGIAFNKVKYILERRPECWACYVRVNG